MSNDPLPSSEPNLDSFVLRFVHSSPSQGAQTGAHTSRMPNPGNRWHGVIRHVQSNRERVFNRWSDAVAFIGEFVNVHDSVQEHDND